MRKVVLTAIVLILFLFLIPILIPNPDQNASDSPEPQGLGRVAQWSDLFSGKTLKVLVNGGVQEMDLNEYILGVVAAEMPASFEVEALKAQAVAARTYALQRRQNQHPTHPGADVCTSPACCQAYITPAAAAKNWGQSNETYHQKILQAVADTKTEVILYEEQLISAVFHSSSAGETLNAVEVWGGSAPYLTGVKSPEGEEVPDYKTEKSVSPEAFRSTFLSAYPDAILEGDPSTWLGDTTRTSGGSVSEMTIGGVTATGQKLRTLYSLRSTSFDIELRDGAFVFLVTGYGHGVGMSQYGANAMAKNGSTYLDILSWYYTGVSIEACPDSLWTP